MRYNLAVSSAEQSEFASSLHDVMATERLVLRPCQISDIGLILDGLGDYEVACMLEGVTLPFLKPDAVEWFHQLPQVGDGGWTYSLNLGDNQPIGLICIRQQKSEWLLQYWLDRPYWGQGYMGEALNPIIGAIFNEHPHVSLRADVYSDDVPALNLQQKLGFVTIGCHERFSSLRSAMGLKIEMQLNANDFRQRRPRKL